MSVARQAAAGVAWNIAAGLSVRALGLVGTLVLTRFLAPGEFGDVMMAGVVVDTAARVANYNLGLFVITHRSDAGEAFQAFVYHVGAIASACLAVTFFRYPIADALGSPGMTRYIPWLAFAMVLLQTSRIPESTLHRAMRFRVLATTRALGEIAYTVVSVGLVPFLRAGAVVAGNLARAATFTAVIVTRSDRSEWLRPVALRLSTARRMLRFGFPLSTRTLAETFSASWDNLLVSRLFGTEVMGQYVLAYRLADIAGEVAEYISDVLLPSLSKLEVDRQRLALPRISAMMALVLFPLIGGLAVVAPAMVNALLDPRWAGVAPMLAILCFRSVPVPINAVLWPYFAARGRTVFLMYLGMVRLALVLGFILTLGRLGPLWACLAVVLAFLLSSLIQVFVGSRLEHLKPGPLLAAVVRPLVASGLMVAVVLLFRATIEAWIAMPAMLALGLEVGVGAAGYAAAAFLVVRPTTLEFIGVVRGVIARKSPE